MRQFFGRKDQHTNELKFSDLPLELGAKINLVLKTGAPFGPFRYEPENSPGTIYSISIVPFQQDGSKEPVSHCSLPTTSRRPSSCGSWKSRLPACVS
jgi:hypothetical protein